MSLLPQVIPPQNYPIGKVDADGNVITDTNWYLLLFNIAKQTLAPAGVAVPVAATDLISLEEIDAQTVDALLVSTARVTGTMLNDNARAGYIGEYSESIIASSPGVSLTSGTAADITSLSLAAGDWDVSVCGGFLPAATTSITQLIAGPSLVSATSPVESKRAMWSTAAVVPGANKIELCTKPVRYSFATATTVYLDLLATFTVAALTGYGAITARRVR